MNFSYTNIKKQYKIRIFTAILLAFFVFSPAVLLASGIEDAQKGMDDTAAAGGIGAGSGAITDLPSAIGRIIGAGLAFVGVIFFILMIYGGFIWMFARGNDQEVAKAKDLITSAVIGLVIILAAYAITYYIGEVLMKGS